MASSGNLGDGDSYPGASSERVAVSTAVEEKTAGPRTEISPVQRRDHTSQLSGLTVPGMANLKTRQEVGPCGEEGTEGIPQRMKMEI